MRGLVVENPVLLEQAGVVTAVLLESGLHTSMVVVLPDVTSSIMVGPT
jgi:hypothetical protein